MTTNLFDSAAFWEFFERVLNHCITAFGLSWHTHTHKILCMNWCFIPHRLQEYFGMHTCILNTSTQAHYNANHVFVGPSSLFDKFLTFWIHDSYSFFIIRPRAKRITSTTLSFWLLFQQLHQLCMSVHSPKRVREII